MTELEQLLEAADKAQLAGDTTEAIRHLIAAIRLAAVLPSYQSESTVSSGNWRQLHATEAPYRIIPTGA